MTMHDEMIQEKLDSLNAREKELVVRLVDLSKHLLEIISQLVEKNDG